MATYVMSDIHGLYDKYESMLRKINFRGSDSLIVIGDVIDRGPHGIKVLQDIMSRNNVELLMGNHELMMLDALNLRQWRPDGVDWLNTWYHNGGAVTATRFYYLSEEEQHKLINYLKGAQFERFIMVNNKRFYLVHGGPTGCDRKNNFKDFEYNVTWNRPVEWNYIPMKDVDHVVFGHTPTAFYQGCEGEHYTVYKSKRQPQLIGIDCGCKPGNIKGRLACLRLDDMEEFYV